MAVKIRSEVTAIADDIIAIRRDIHKYPELGFDEHRTSGVVAKHLKNLEFDVVTGIGKTGVIGDLKGNTSGQTIGLRADMDALPIQETGDIPYRSVNDGIMHACGHDGHTAMLLGTATVLKQFQEHLKGNVRFIFQPAEEGGGGARYMIDDGCLNTVDEIFGVHLWNYQKSVSYTHLTLPTICSV